MILLRCVLVVLNFIQPSFQLVISNVSHSDEVCPETLLHDNTLYKIAPMDVAGVVRLCCGCNPGFYVQELCSSGNASSTKCKACIRGTYIQDYAHGRTSCVIDPVTSCPPRLIYVPGNGKKPSRCNCPPGCRLTLAGKCVKIRGNSRLHYPRNLETSPYPTTALETPIPFTKPYFGTISENGEKTSDRDQTKCRNFNKDQILLSLHDFILTILISILISALCSWLSTCRYYRPRMEQLYLQLVTIRSSRSTMPAESYISSSTTLSSFNGAYRKKRTCFCVEMFSCGSEHNADDKVSVSSFFSFSREDDTTFIKKQIILKLREKLSMEFLDGDLNPFIRHFVPDGRSPEQFIQDIRNRNGSISEMLICAFNQLHQELGSKEFNPISIHDYLMTGRKTNLAELIEPEVSEWRKLIALEANSLADRIEVDS